MQSIMSEPIEAGEYKGFKYRVKRIKYVFDLSLQPQYSHAGYILIPESHPLFGHSYSTQLEFLNQESMDTYFHAGTTGINFATYTDHGFTIGFESDNPHDPKSLDDDKVLAVSYTKDLIDQIIDAENIYRIGGKVYEALKTMIYETIEQEIKDMNNDKDKT